MDVRFDKHGKNLIEFDVRNYDGVENVPENFDEDDVMFCQGTFIESYAIECFNKIQKLKYDWVKDFYFCGRSNGWYCIEVEPNTDYLKKTKQIDITSVVEKYFDAFNSEFEKYLIQKSQEKSEKNKE